MCSYPVRKAARPFVAFKPLRPMPIASMRKAVQSGGQHFPDETSCLCRLKASLCKSLVNLPNAAAASCSNTVTGTLRSLCPWLGSAGPFLRLMRSGAKAIGLRTETTDVDLGRLRTVARQRNVGRVGRWVDGCHLLEQRGTRVPQRG